MRVAHFVQRYPPALGGSEAYFARLGRYLAGHGDSVTVFTSNAVDLESFWSSRGRCVESGVVEEYGVEVRRYPLVRFPGRRYVLKALNQIPNRRWQGLTLPCNPISLRMWREAGRTDVLFDVVHATAFPYAWPIHCGLRLARRLKIPLVLTPFLHLGDPENSRDRSRKAYLAPPLRWLLHAASVVFVQTALERDAVLDAGVVDERVVLQGMGVDPGECTGGDRDRARTAWDVRPGEVVVGHLANQSVEKGSVDLLRAAHALWEKGGRDFRIVLAGPEMANFRVHWDSNPPKCPVIRLGVLDDRQKRDFLAGLDVFALPSRSDSFGLVLLEAWANGVPDVGYRAGGVAEVIRHEDDGLLVKCGDTLGLAAALDRLIQNEELRRRLGESGRRRVFREMTWGPKLDLVREVYQKMTRSPQR